MTTTEAGAPNPAAPSADQRGTTPGDTPDTQAHQGADVTNETAQSGESTEATEATGDEIVTDHDRGVHGYHHNKAEHLKRLRRIEGQIRGLQRLVEEDVYCIDILTQVSASTKGLQSFALQLLEEHLRHCVADAALKGGDEIDAKVEEATKAIARMLRT
ncbi:metal-sensitive transcriptional regulator [Streptomyces albidoflavus]|uniref:Metal-sensitive transcriptional regulator n=1 Tax=Streptomyces albidoflavus TaxID=1886 RepID=A0AB37XFA1_9ACTN|nr:MULTISPECIES: metal-sensitive transcriptional regulator [Streptomyces]MBO1287992.1 metal-sensitive transcriptional regulator [Streptomyces sampsonii]NUW08388.1 metal-sensitive transcriptional regulator [Streptomyces sp. CAI-21]NVI30528.1 metal-sensitive transcriptional regulator [Streptomyces sp. CAI-17]QLA58041.1 metal-sensitive transcriptional regulator [Streptomyces violascens]SCD93084.1 DNA-binding transcriptional regulator, FrmR family [Streptomyces sp. IgraMP-1]BDH52324.1 hypothetica